MSSVTPHTKPPATLPGSKKGMGKFKKMGIAALFIGGGFMLLPKILGIVSDSKSQVDTIQGKHPPGYQPQSYYG